MSGQRVLLVDDDVRRCRTVGAMLTNTGHKVTCANSPETAKHVFDEINPEVIITVLDVADGTGERLLSDLTGDRGDIVSILHGGIASLDRMRRALRTGVDGYILEPFDCEEMERLVLNVRHHHRPGDESICLGDLNGLYQVSEAATAAVGRNELLNMILRLALLQTGATRGSVMLKDDTGRYMRIVAAVGLDQKLVGSLRVGVGDGIAGVVAEGGQPLLVGNVEEHPDLAKLARQYREKSFMSVPLEVQETVLSVPVKTTRKIVGVINVHRKCTGGRFTERDLKLLCMLANQAAVCIENERLRDDLENTYMNAFGSMALLLEAKDPYTQGHTERVSGLCEELGRMLSLDADALHALMIGARLHDLGKIAIHESILNKPGKFTDDEWMVVRQHPVVADRVLAPIMLLQDARPIVRGHHERLDGTGYPDGLTGNQLVMGQRIIIVADAYDAMSSDRSYRTALAPEKIKEQLLAHTGTQFDSEVVESLLDLVGLRKLTISV